MNRLLLTMFAAGAFLGIAAGSASAQAVYYGGQQSFQPFGAPRLSPYLNLVRTSNNPAAPAANYFIGTVSEIERRGNARQFGNAIQGLERQVTGQEDSEELFPTLAGTGHVATFNNLGGYFNQRGQATGGNIGGVGRAPQPRKR